MMLRNLTCWAMAGMLAVPGLVTAADEKPAPNQVLLRLHLAKGQTYRLRLSNEQTITQMTAGQQQVVRQTSGTDYDFLVEEANDLGYVTKITFLAMRMKTDGPQGKMEYDSQNPPAKVPLAAGVLAGLVGQSYHVSFAPNGEVRKLEGLAALVEKAVLGVEVPDAAQRESIRQTMRTQFGDEAMQQMMGQMLTQFPANPVAVGDTWQRKQVIAQGFPMVIESFFALRSRADGLAKISLRSNIKPNAEAAPMRMGTTELRMMLAGEQDGELVVEEATGWTAKGRVSQKLTGAMKMMGAQHGPEGMSIPLTVVTTTEFESLPPAPVPAPTPAPAPAPTPAPAPAPAPATK